MDKKEKATYLFTSSTTWMTAFWRMPFFTPPPKGGVKAQD